jgi:hypothetical protein
METYFGKVKSTPYQSPVYTYSNMREYVETNARHIKHLEKVIDTLIQDVHLLEHKILQSKLTSKKEPYI